MNSGSAATCTTCHPGVGGDWNSAAGAHASHVGGGHGIAAPIACETCHAVPATPGAAGHLDGSVQVRFAEAALRGAPGTWSSDRGTCAVYCHGATLRAPGAPPVWARIDGTHATCTSCHGAPPPSPHPDVPAELDTCSVCHPDSVAATGALVPPASGGRHLDGELEVAGHDAGWIDPAAPGFHGGAVGRSGLASCARCHGEDLEGGAGRACSSCHDPAWRTTCTGCHGTAGASAAPPRATWGNSAPQAAGAHASHLSAAHGISRPVACAACHLVPADALAAGHANGAVEATGYTGDDPALLAAVSDPGYARSGAGGSCATSYCHGATLEGGSRTVPEWTRTDGTQVACGTCHGRPPRTGPIVTGSDTAHWFHLYRKNLSCAVCHDGFTTTSVDPALHVNGVRDVRARHLACEPLGCDPDVDAGCACAERVATITGWDCASCHSKFAR